MGIFADWYRGAKLVQDQRDFNRTIRTLAKLHERGGWDEGLEHKARQKSAAIGIKAVTADGDEDEG